MRTKGESPFERRLRRYREQDGLCWLCGETLDMFQPQWTYGSCSWEHIVPLSSGGSDTWKNVVISHRECNCVRADRFVWKVERPTRNEWQGCRSWLYPKKANRRFVWTWRQVIKIMKRLPAYSTAT